MLHVCGLKDAKGRTPVFLDLADLEEAWAQVAATRSRTSRSAT